MVAIEDALARSELTETRWCIAELLRIKGELVLLEGAHNSEDTARDLFLQALDWARRQSALLWELRAATSLCQLWHDRGRTKEALELLAPIHDLFTEGFETTDLRAAKALIGKVLASSESPAKAFWGWKTAGGAAGVEARYVSNFPEPVSGLIGREAEFREVADLIRMHRVVTLTGEGGVGKTRLGIEVSRHLLPEFADGARVAELAPLSDPGLVSITVATALGLKFAVGAITAERVASALSASQLVLVLDNCEHLIDAAANIAEALLRAHPAIRVLATSREPLRVAGEHLYRVPALAVPAEGIEDTDELLRHGSAQLFLTRVRAVDPHFSLDGRTPVVAAAICRQLDGIPLAIELAAARGAALGMEELASRLDDRFDLLIRGYRTALPRHQTLKATLDWSYDLLTGPEREVLRRLAIFAGGGFTLEAAGVVAASGEISESDIVDSVGNLVSKSLVAADVSGGVVRYWLLETTRAYSLQKLAESGEFQTVARRHAEYYRDFFEQVEAKKETRPASEWVVIYRQQIGNVRTALDWVFSTGGEAAIGVALTLAAVPLWMRLSLVDECRGRVEQALSAIAHGENQGTPEEMQLSAALGASLLYTKGPAPETGAAWTRALGIAEKHDDVECQLRALRGLWAYRLNNGEYRAALTLAQRFSSLAAKQTAPEDLLVGERMTGTALHYLGSRARGTLHSATPPAAPPANTLRWVTRV